MAEMEYLGRFVQKIAAGERERDKDKEEKREKESIAQQAKHVKSMKRSQAGTAEEKLVATSSHQAYP
eukprot:scaffold99577_cov16-Tisochrysis_lutea.AAC.1